LGESWILGGWIGLGGMKGESSTFLAAQYSVTGAYKGCCDWFYPEVMAGAESWFTDQGSTYATAGANLHFPLHLDQSVLNRVQNIYAGYQAIFTSEILTSQIQLGIQFGI
jgi:hypothetical protein